MKTIAILGHGTVGSGVVDILNKNNKYIYKTYDDFFEISFILVKTLEKYKKNKDFSKFIDEFQDILDSDCEIIVEVMGGIHPALEYIEAAIKNRKHIITANKDLIAEYGEHLEKLANKHGVTINYEASVGGGIPIIKTIKESLGLHKVNSVTGILNGTTNFILSQMYNNDLEYDHALKLAQDAGFAEADPSSDVLGLDAARKLSILTKLSMNKNLNVRNIMIDGITKVDKKDILTAKQLGYKIKLVSKCTVFENSLHGFVKPIYVKSDSQLGLIDNEYNAINIDIDTMGTFAFSGKGAGKEATASAILGDLIDILINKKKTSTVELDSDFKVSHYSFGKNDWLVRMYSLNDVINLERIFKHFNQVNVEIRDFTNPSDLAFIVKGISESNLFDILNKLSNLNAISVSKYFMIL